MSELPAEVLFQTAQNFLLKHFSSKMKSSIAQRMTEVIITEYSQCDVQDLVQHLHYLYYSDTACNSLASTIKWEETCKGNSKPIQEIRELKSQPQKKNHPQHDETQYIKSGKVANQIAKFTKLSNHENNQYSEKKSFSQMNRRENYSKSEGLQPRYSHIKPRKTENKFDEQSTIPIDLVPNKPKSTTKI